MDACEVAAMKAELMRQFAAFDFTRRGNAMIDAQAAAVQHGPPPAAPPPCAAAQENTRYCPFPSRWP